MSDIDVLVRQLANWSNLSYKLSPLCYAFFMLIRLKLPNNGTAPLVIHSIIINI